jgi:hypothetical protein
MTAPMTTVWVSSSRTIIGQNARRCVFVEHDVVAVLELHQAEFVVANRAVVLGLDLRHLELRRARAADVERAHRELRAGFADGLRGDDADRFAQLDRKSGGEVAP